VDAYSLEQTYSSKTDDELLALAVERTSLEPEAQSILSAELRRRKLTDPRFLHHRATDEAALAQNPAFNFPAKAAAGLMFLGCVGVLLTLIIAAAQVHLLFKFILVFVLVWGPIFAVLAWATRRALRNPPSRIKNARLRVQSGCCKQMEGDYT
jgi:hypothetical protein